MKRFALGFAALFLVIFVNFIYEKLSRPTHFTVTPDTKIDPNSELAKYVTQEEIDDFAFRYWDIDKYEENNATLNALRNLLRLKNTDKILNFMTRNGLSADVKMKANTTPLMYASFYDDEVTAKRLIDVGANAHAKDNYKLSPLAYAIENNSTKTVKLLLDSGVRLEEAGRIQSYLDYALYDFIDSIVIDKDDIHINFDFPDTDSKGASDPFAYVIANNLLEISKMFFELGYKPECTFKAQRNEEFDCFGILAHIPNYEPMLNLLLDNNVSGQPTKEELKEAYEKCYKSYRWHVDTWKKEIDKNQTIPLLIRMSIENGERYCPDKDGTFGDTRTFMYWANEKNKLKNMINFWDGLKNNPSKVIYIDANISSQDKEKLISNKLIQKRRSKNAAERR
ncbi:ankyrin repeat domain-containing protein [Campylobacter showae]|uniref:ankyrin repeat domain-containing protein n=1 Tax=Campylobacter showae TaxID=204 RepID=UPI000F082585|nr:ankyrin repeat domain-containing protein [Campylobacter showae]